MRKECTGCAGAFFRCLTPTSSGMAMRRVASTALRAPRLGTSEGGERSVEGRARPHRRRGLRAIGQVIAAGVDGLSLRGDQLGVDLGLVLRERLRERFEAGR